MDRRTALKQMTFGAGGTLLDIKEADRSIDMILDILVKNEG